MSQSSIIITIVYEPSSGEVGLSVTKLGDDTNVNLKDLLLALHAAEGQYIQALQEPPQPPGLAEAPEVEDGAAKD